MNRRAPDGADQRREAPRAVAPTGTKDMDDAGLPVFRNQILRGLSEGELAHLAPELEPIGLLTGSVLEAPGEAIEHVYFLDSGLASMMAVDTCGRHMETGLLGRDGMTGLALVMGDDRSPHETVIQLPGAGHRLTSGRLREAMRKEPTIRDWFLRFTHAFVIQVAQTALANGRSTLEARLARWLLMCQDRTDAEDLPLTHKYLSIMLGVRRAGVTTAIQIIESQGVIKATRGCIRILDRGTLEAIATGAYGVSETEYARLMVRA